MKMWLLFVTIILVAWWLEPKRIEIRGDDAKIVSNSFIQHRDPYSIGPRKAGEAGEMIFKTEDGKTDVVHYYCPVDNWCATQIMRDVR